MIFGFSNVFSLFCWVGESITLQIPGFLVKLGFPHNLYFGKVYIEYHEKQFHPNKYQKEL